MKRVEVRRRFWVEIVAFAIAVTLAIMTLVWREWIEIIFGVDPDQGSGSLEVVITLVAAAVALLVALVARSEWRRAARQPAVSSDP